MIYVKSKRLLNIRKISNMSKMDSIMETLNTGMVQLYSYTLDGEH